MDDHPNDAYCVYQMNRRALYKYFVFDLLFRNGERKTRERKNKSNLNEGKVKRAVKRINLKAKGTKGERDLVHLFWANGYVAIRAPGSGSIKYPCPDIIAGTPTRKLAIESKVCSDSAKYFPKDEIAQLKEFASRFGAEPWIAIKFSGKEWAFMSLDDLTETEKSFVVTRDSAQKKGLLFEEIIDG